MTRGGYRHYNDYWAQVITGSDSKPRSGNAPTRHHAAAKAGRFYMVFMHLFRVTRCIFFALYNRRFFYVCDFILFKALVHFIHCIAVGRIIKGSDYCLPVIKVYMWTLEYRGH